MKERRYDMDWMRVIAMLSVFIFHCTRFFCTEDWHLKVPVSQQSEVLTLARDFTINMWFMELFVLVSGFAAWYALRRRTGGQLLVERVKRLLIPLYTVGLFILVVPQQYFEFYTHGQVTHTFWQWLPSYYLGLPASLFNLAGHNYADPIQVMPYTFAGHLWFIQMLFIVTLATLPLLLYLRSDRGQRLVARLAGWAARPGGIFVFVIPLAIVQVGLRWMPITTDRTWADFFWYALFFVIGYILAGDDRFTESVKKHGWLCLALWVVLYVGVGGLFEFVLGFDTKWGNGFSLGFGLWQITRATIVWSAVVFMLSLGAKYLNFTNGLLSYSNEAVLPFFLFHQTIILIVGWFILPLNMGNWAEFLLIVAISFPVILILYEVFVRHIGFMRLLFGMTPKIK
jgi:surface polysaccharide O-acyltransferase-like enzyme